MTYNKKPGVAFWATVVVVVVVLYAASFGPAQWLALNSESPEWIVAAWRSVYSPVLFLRNRGPLPIQNAIRCYADVWSDNHQPDRGTNPLF